MQVALAMELLDKDLTDKKKCSEVDILPLLGASYSGMLAHDVSRRLKKVPTAFYPRPPTRLFDENSIQDFAGWETGV